MVEFAIVCPVVLLLLLGIIEIGHAMLVGQVLNNAARSGCRAGSLAGGTNTAVTTAVTNNLVGISSPTVTTLVNGSPADVSSAYSGDAITVQVSVPYSKISWVPTPQFLSGATLTGKAVMCRE